MEIYINVVNQKLHYNGYSKKIVAGTQNFVRFYFNLSDGWEDLYTFAQFSQNDESYNAYLDNEKSVYLPSEIVKGKCVLALQGNQGNVRAISEPIVFDIVENPIIQDAQGTQISQSLYDQLSAKIVEVVEEIASVDAKVTQLENSEVLKEEVRAAVEQKMAEFLAQDVFAAMAIGDGTLERKKVDADFEIVLQKAETAMQPGIYDPRGIQSDIYAYAQSKADIVQTNLNNYKGIIDTYIENIQTELKDAYKLTDTISYTTLGDALRGAIELAKSYTEATLMDYNAFTIKIVDILPEIGTAQTFYLIPNSSNTGYDKYWWITDTNGLQKWDKFGSSSTLVVTELPSVGDADIDYILTTNTGCVYYKWIEGKWVAVSGSMAVVLEQLPETGDTLTDYYIKNESGSYVHYRWIDGVFVVVGASGSSYTDTEITAIIDEKTSGILNDIESIQSSLTTHEDKISSLETTTASLSSYAKEIVGTDDGFQVIYGDGTSANIATKDNSIVMIDLIPNETGLTKVYSDNSTEDIEISGGGGIVTSGSASIVRITNNVVQCVYGGSFPIEFTFSALDSSGETVNSGTATWYVGSVKKATSTVYSGYNSFDIGSYLNIGANNIKISVSVDTGGDTATVTTKTWTVTAINLYATWEYDDATINTSDKFTFRWTPYGDLEKTTHIIIDGDILNEYTSTTTRSGTLQYMEINKLSHGSHFVELYLTATINNTNIESEHLYHDLIFADSEVMTPIVASSYPDNTTIIQYNTAQIPIVVYDPTSLTTDVVLSIDGVVVSTWNNIDRTVHYWNYTPSDYGNKVLTISCANVYGTFTRTINMIVEALDIDNAEIDGYSFRLKASDLAGNSALQTWSSNDVTATFSDNFDWNNGGIQTELDDNGNIRQYICVKAGTTMTINHKLFADDPRSEGKNIKFIFKVTNCRDYDAMCLNCFSNNIGIQVSAHEAIFSSAGTSLSVPYAEDSYMELEFDVYPIPKNNSTPNPTRYMMAWIDGVPTTCRVYGETDNFTQTNTQNITIGSNDCDVYVYMVKAYPIYLTRDNHIENFIADAPNAQEMVDRYNRNNILDASGDIDYEKLAAQNPDCRVWLYDIPRFTQGKKDYVSDCTFQQIWENGDQYYQITGTGTMSIQGTSSVDYLKGAGNTDINFAGGELRDGNGNDISTIGFKIRDNSIPILYSNTKVNFASCEQVNNMCNAEWYNRFQPYLTPNRALNPNARDCMEFAMGVQFIHDQSGDLWNDTKFHMYSIANMGNSKKNVEVFHDITNPLECCIEVNNNLNDQCRMISDDLTNEDWSGDMYFGMRYPDTKTPSQEIKDGWQRFLTWMATSNPNAYTGKILSSPVTFEPYTFKGHDGDGTQVLQGTTVSQYAGTYTHDTFEYRMAKMLSECEDYMIMDSVVYHFCYIERHTMVDNVAKNTFWSSSDCIHYHLAKNYDNDTSDGNNNEGQLVFDYGNEADDVIGTKTVFNAADSVWFVFVSNLFEACQTMFINREALGAWDAKGYHDYLTSEQKKVPERCWVECFWYDYLRTYEQGISEAWMDFLDGGQKIHQREHYETFEEAYDSSKYRGTACTVQNVTLRGYTPSVWTGVEPKSEVSIKMYNKMYIVIRIDQIYKSIKAERGQLYTIDFSDCGTLNDTVINFYTAQMIQEIGDISHLYPGYCSFANAIRLRSLQIGSAVTGYSNTNLTSLGFGNNTMLEYLYVQNLPNANQNLDLSRCASLLVLDATGSSFTGYTFATGGLLREAYIESPTSLSLRDLYYLTNENFHVTSYENLSSLRVENCPDIDTLTIVTAANNLARVRLLDIDWVTTTDLLDRMLILSGMDESGLNTTVSVLTGTVYVPIMRNQKLISYNESWDNLVITYETMVTQYIATFVNRDGTPILDYNGNPYVQYVDRGSDAYDPIASGEVPTPTAESTPQYTFTFDGWDDLTQFTSNRTITAVYIETLRQYTVQWLQQVGVILKTETVDYGSSAEYGDEYPTRTDEESQFIYYLFDGWDKFTGYITEDTIVMAKWQRAELPALGTDLSTMTPAEIYGVVKAGKATDYFTIKDYVDIQMGYDVDYSNVESKVLADNLILDGTNIVDTGIKLFDEDKSFTLAIDFNYDDYSTQSATLVSCFDTDGYDGFELYYNDGVQIRWSTVNSMVGYQNYRNVVVIRHIKGENSIYVYSFDNSNSTAYSADIAASIIDRSKTTQTQANLVFGGRKLWLDSSVANYAVGKIHYAKIWYADLGSDECMKLVSWPRETHRFELYGTKKYILSDGSGYCAASFIMNDLLERTKAMGVPNTSGWELTLMRTFCNGKLYNGFPNIWRQLIKQVRITTSKGYGSTEIVTTNDYVYIPAYVSVATSCSSDILLLEDTHIPWCTAMSIRIKAKCVTIPEDATYYTTSKTSDPSLTNNVKQGDVWIQNDNGNIGYVYNNGAWKEASAYWLRSPYLTSTTNYYFIGNTGNLTTQNGTTYSLGVLPCFSI